MNSPNTCPQCDAKLPADAPEGLCPACLMRGGLDTDATIKMTPSQKPTPSQPAPTPLPEELAPLFPQLEILELLGRGGMGTVYKARQPKLNRFVALKIISAEAGADPHFAERFQREAQALAKLNHPHIVSVFDFGETSGLFFFLMEYVDGANLRTLIRSGEMKPEAALALIPAFCDALQYAHDEGVVHRDIKPENVLVDKKGRVKIADFGLAKLTGSDAHDHTLTRTGMYLGTPRYMAPEQVEKPETVDHRADIYSLGVVFYEMLTGELPMGRFDPPSKKVQVDVRFDEIVLHALERDVALRYQHASEIKTDVQSVTGCAATTPPIPLSGSEPSSDDETISRDALDVLKVVLLVIQSLAWLGIGLGVLGMASAAAAVDQEGSGADAMAALWDRVLLFGWVIGGSLLALAMLAKAKRDGRRPFALAAALLVSSNCGFLGVLSQGLWHVPWHVSLLIGCIAAFCIVILLCGSGIGPDIPAAFSALAAPRQKPLLAEPRNPGLSEPRLSRCAVTGVVWACLGMLATVPLLVGLVSMLREGLIITDVFWTLAVLVPTFTAIGTTILGAISMNNIKRSGGKLYGLPLAFADVVLFPMLLVCAAISLLIALALHSILPVPFAGGLAVGVLAAVVAGFFIGRALWRKVAGKPASSGGDIGSKLNLAAIGLLLAGIVNAFAGLIWIGASISDLTEAIQQGAPLTWLILRLLLSLGSIAVVYYTIGSALFLMHRKDDGDITFPLVMAALAPPGCIFGLPAAIYALVLLSKPEAKALFPQPKLEPETAVKPKTFLRETWWFSRSPGMQKLMGIALGTVLVLALLGFFSFRMQATTTADHSGVVRNLYDVTVGAGDPWLYLFQRKVGTRGGMESGMNFLAGSALFGFAALCSGIALIRLTREQKRRASLADASADTPQRKFFWNAVAGAVLFIAGGAGVVVHEVRNDNNGSLLADAVHEVHPDFTRPGITSLALKKAIADELQLTPEQLEKVNASLNRAYLDFLKLENEHSSYRSENGHLVKFIKPFPDRSFELAQKLAAELRGIAGKAIIDAPERNAVWKLRLFRHAGEFDVRAELWEKDGKFHRDESWMRNGEKVMGGKSGDTLDDMKLAFGHYFVDWEAQKDIIHEPRPDDATSSHTLGSDVPVFFIERIRNGELARLMAVKDPDTVVKSGDPHAALVTQAGTGLGRACAETELKRHGITFAKEATAEELVTKLEALLGKPQP